MTVKGIQNNKHSSDKYVILPFKFLGTTRENNRAYAAFECEVTIVDGLDANMLLGTDIMGPEKFDISLSTGPTAITSCQDIQLPMTVWKDQKPAQWTTRAKEETIIPLKPPKRSRSSTTPTGTEYCVLLPSRFEDPLPPLPPLPLYNSWQQHQD